MFVLAFSVATAAPPSPALPAEEERIEAESLEHLDIEPLDQKVPAWPDMRPFRPRPTENALIGVAVGAVTGILVASLVPDRAVLQERRAAVSPCAGGGQTLNMCI